MPGVIHITARRNQVGGYLNELNIKKANSATVKQHANVMKWAHILNPLKTLRERSESISSSSSISSVDSQSTFSSTQADLDRMTMENINACGQNPNVQSKSSPVTIDDTLFVGINDSTTCLKPQRNESQKVKKQVRFEIPEQIAKSPTSTKADSPYRFKPRPFLCSDIDGYVAPDKRNPNLEKCKITHNGSKIEHEMKRNHEFQTRSKH